jgi:NADPH-dependent glutamate synthase beta subunit-like oxidoreductase
MPAIKEEIEMAEQEGVTINFLSAPTRILAERGRVQGLECIRTTLGEPDASGRRRPIPAEGTEFTVETDMVIAAVGEQPDLSPLEDEEITVPAKAGLLEVDPLTLETGIPGLFAGGDAVTGPSYAIDAFAAGRKAAISIDRFIKGEDLSVGREGEGPQATRLVVNAEGVGEKPRQCAVTLPLQQRRANFAEVELGLSESQAKEEAERCLSCGCWECLKSLACPAMKREEGAVVIEDAVCPGCGICAQICPVDAIVPR